MLELIQKLVLLSTINMLAYSQLLERTALDNHLEPFRAFRKFVLGLVEPTVTKESLNDLRNKDKIQKEISNNQSFPCKLNGIRSPRRPTSVHKLRPGDIDVIAAIGDSISAGYGLFSSNLIHMVLESRGAAFSMGGDATWREFLTIPNILKEFNPNLIGYSRGNSLTIDRRSQFNVAEAGAVSKNMPYMSTILIRRIQNDPRVDINKDWKLITVFFGMNDICSEICYFDNPEKSIQEHREHLLAVLRALRDNLPRTLIVLIPPINTTFLKNIKNKSPTCELIHSFVCPCVVGLTHEHFFAKLDEIALRWQEMDVEIGDYSEFAKEDFAITTAAFTINMSLPQDATNNFDLKYFAADCFHLSQIGTAALASNLWNNLLTPKDNKRMEVDYNIMANFKCPTTENPFIFINNIPKM